MPGKLPFLDFLARTQVRVTITGGLTKHGEPEETLVYNGRCIYDEKSRQVLDSERRLVRLSARAIIKGDICPGKNIEGYVEVAGGPKRSIFRAARPRNPDGTVYSTELELV